MLGLNNWGRRQQARILPHLCSKVAELAALGLKVPDQGENKFFLLLPAQCMITTKKTFQNVQGLIAFLSPRISSDCHNHPMRLARQDFVLLSWGSSL